MSTKIEFTQHTMRPQEVLVVDLMQTRNMNYIWMLLEEKGCAYNADDLGVVMHKMEKSKQQGCYLLLFPELKDSKFVKKEDLEKYIGKDAAYDLM